MKPSNGIEMLLGLVDFEVE